MAGYNWLVILFCMGFFGLLYASTYGITEEFYNDAYQDTTDAALGVKIIWACWQYSPVILLFSCFIYGVQAAQKTKGGGF